MKFPEDTSTGFVPSIHHIYNSSIASTASTSFTSVWSDASSQSSDDASVFSTSSDSESCDSYSLSRQTSFESVGPQPIAQPTKSDVVPPELRQNPRRSGLGSRGGCPPPSLVRQSDRKVNFVDNLVDSSTQIVEAIWPLSSAACRSELGSKGVLPLRTFIQETLRRSRTSYSTLQVALYYLILIKSHVPKPSFNTEQREDRHAERALQCGRRMFLAALILASKYLQDRNYSARAWSKISGLNTQEINQNEIAFLISVNWKLHIVDEVFQRWTDIVLKYTPAPTSPPPSGVPQQVSQQAADWKRIILGLNTDLTNIDELVPSRQMSLRFKSDLIPQRPRSILNATQGGSSEAVNAVSKLTNTPMVMEPTPISVLTSSRQAPALGMLPTPRLTPQSSGGFCTPAASAIPQRTSMSMAISQVNNISASHFPSISLTPPQQGQCLIRRSSLAHSVSTMSSPESMISDSSRTSFTSSISSATSFASATTNNNKLSFASRFRAAKLADSTLSVRQSVPSFVESCDAYRPTSSPESCDRPVRRLGARSTETLLTTRERYVRDAASDAARILQELHSERAHDKTPTGSKRGRAPSMESALEDNVRNMLAGRYGSEPNWPDSILSHDIPDDSYVTATAVATDYFRSTKRVCCSAEAASEYDTAPGPHVLGIHRSGMWHGILN